MFIITIIFAIACKVSGGDVCADVCVCRDNIHTDDIGEIVDCSFNNGDSVLKNSLPSAVFSLNLSSSNITRLESSRLLQSTTLIELYLNKNGIKKINSNVLVLPELKRLDLSCNRIEYIDKEAFRDISKLEYLNIANNKLYNHNSLSFHRLRNLNDLVLDNNDLGAAFGEVSLFERNGFGLTHKIQKLSISGINLNSVPENFFSYAYDLRKLTISKNNLTEIFELPFTLEYVDLSDNPIAEISEEDFSDLPGLKVLKLNNLQIKEVAEFVFVPLKSLTHLELERNKRLTVFSSLAFGQEVLEDADDFALQTLSLKGSRLKKIGEEMSELLGHLIILDLQGNPWRCDCTMKWVKNLQIQPKYNEHVRCDWPKTLYNSKIFDLDSKYFTCAINSHHVGLAIAVTAFCVMLTAIALWLFVCLPKYQSRCTFISKMATPTAAYTMLPVHSHVGDI